ncbi:MAG: L,D-transpeptidase, partial [Pseudomonadota bacterium]
MISRTLKFLSIVLLCVPSPILADGEYEIEVVKSERRLHLKRRGVIEKSYLASWGRGGTGDKEQQGDKRTPEGTYRVVGLNRSKRFDFFIRLNYPNVKDAFKGYKRKAISHDQFKNILYASQQQRLPPQNTVLGGAIGIHGIGVETPEKIRIHTNLNWTEGCIALRNSEVQELLRYIDIGTRVTIS